MIIGVDYHPSFQQIAFFEEETGECGEQELNHSDRQAEKFYRDLKQRGISELVERGYRRAPSASEQIGAAKPQQGVSGFCLGDCLLHSKLARGRR